MFYFCHLKKLVRPETFEPYLIYELGNKAEQQPEKQMARRMDGWKTSWWNRVEGKSTQQEGMEEAPENGKQSSRSAHTNEWSCSYASYPACMTNH